MAIDLTLLFIYHYNGENSGDIAQKTAEKISEALGTDTEKEFLSSANGFYEWFLYAALLNKDSEAVRNMFEVSLPQHKLCECSAKIKTVFGSDIAKSDEEREAQNKTEAQRSGFGFEKSKLMERIRCSHA